MTKGAVAAERIPGGFAAVYPVLRAMEETGQCRRGYFVEGLGGAQFALPGAVDRMRALAGDAVAATRRRYPAPAEAGHRWAPASRTWTRFRPDPGRPRHEDVTGGRSCSPRPTPRSPTGRRCRGRPGPRRPRPSHRPGRKAGAVVVLFAGELVLYVERGGKTLLSWTEDPAALEPCAQALAAAVRDGALGRITVEKADGGIVATTPRSPAPWSRRASATPPAACACAAEPAPRTSGGGLAAGRVRGCRLRCSAQSGVPRAIRGPASR